MAEEVVRHNLNTVTEDERDTRIGALKASRDFEFRSYLPVTDTCHFERYTFACGKEKLGVVYDTKAQILSFTAKASVLALVPGLGSFVQKPPEPPAEKATKPAPAQKPQKDKTKKPMPAQKPPKEKAKQAACAQNSAKKEPPKAAETTQELPEYKDGFSVKKCPPERLSGILERIRALKGVRVTKDDGKDVITYAVADKVRQQKCSLRYTVKKQTVQLQGKRSNLFGEVQVLLSSGSEFGDAMGSYKKQTRTSTVQRDLKKLLPSAVDLLSEQSKIDLGIGMVDIGNEDVKLSDYSVLLVPPYRGLERFIYDLQQSKGIAVKMIGQAYEKTDGGEHVLKQCYRRKTGVVYSEVMSALYNEYFERRNFYAHSDNSQAGQSRVIADKSAAKAIFTRLCEIIDYNCKKLKEIGFSLIPSAK